MSYKNFTHIMMTVVTTISCFIAISSYAAPTIQKIGMSPANTEIRAGSEAIAFTVKASGSKLTYQWTLQGEGTLQDPTTQPAVFYTPPQQIDTGSAQVIISIIVKDDQGNEATESMLLRILGNSTPIQPTPNPDREGQLIFQEDFEHGIQRKIWEKDGEKIELVNDPIYGQCVKVSRTSPGGWTQLRKKFKGYSGTLVFEAMVKVETIVPGKEEWHRARFDTEISKPGEKQKQYPGHYYDETFDWTLESFEADYLDGSETVELMISVLQTKGTIYVDNIKVYHLP